MALFEAHNLSKRFGDQVVLEDISLKFEKGQLSGIMGPNGAGKSTCFNVLTGHFPPDRGRVILDGEDITGFSPRQIAQKGVARSFQIISLFDEFTALENVLLALPEVRSAGFNVVRDVAGDSSTVAKALAVIEQVGLRASADIRSASLSYGERRSLEIAVALAAEPRILFLDEPTQGMGSDGRARLLELIGQLKRHFTIVMIEHDMDFLFSLADQVSVIHWGQVIAQGTPAELYAARIWR
jgi:branched-chain amino acid transport system ATP-binding protein